MATVKNDHATFPAAAGQMRFWNKSFTVFMRKTRSYGLTTPSSATPGRGRGCEHGGARRRRGLCRASWRAAQPVTEPVGLQPRPVTERQSPEFAAAHG